MFSDTELKHLEDKIARKRVEIHKLQRESAEVREWEQTETRNLRKEAQDKMEKIERHLVGAEREIERLESESARRRYELERELKSPPK